MAEVLVICVGDLGRSPRICKAAIKLAKQSKCQVNILGFLQTPVYDELKRSVKIHALHEGSRRLGPVVRQLVRIASICYALVTLPRLSTIMIQNPPSAFILWLLLLYRWFQPSTKVVVDCHNYGYTIAQCNGYSSLVCKVLEFVEFYGLRRADIVLTVSERMKADLMKRWHRSMKLPKMQTIYDLPDLTYERPSADFCLRTLQKYAPEAGLASARLRIITATSYTPDEAVVWVITAAANLSQQHGPVELIITGRGPMFANVRQHCEKVKASRPNLTIAQIFVDHEDYLPVLCAANVGVCLHISSSGLDLPMKIVDMRTAGIAVLAYEYPTLNEIMPQTNCHFKTSAELELRLEQYLLDDKILNCSKSCHAYEKQPDLVRCLFN